MPEAPLRFGVVADVQYADQPPTAKRAYRDSLAKLEACNSFWRAERPAFVIQLGDLVDGGEDNLARIRAVWEQAPAPRYDVFGNHDPGSGRYYDFDVGGWRFIVLNGRDLNQANAPAMLAELRAAGSPRAQDWNGGIGREQLGWLAARLADAHARGRRAVIFCHWPVHPRATTLPHLLWNAEEVLAAVEREPAAALWLNGHDHAGGCAEDAAIPHITLPGLVENRASDACFMAELYDDRFVLKPLTGVGRVHPLRKR